MELAKVKEDYEYRESRFRIDVAMTVMICCLTVLMLLKFGLSNTAVILEIGLGVVLIVNLFYRWNALKDIKQIMGLLEEKKDDR